MFVIHRQEMCCPFYFGVSTVDVEHAISTDYVVFMFVQSYCYLLNFLFTKRLTDYLQSCKTFISKHRRPN